MKDKKYLRFVAGLPCAVCMRKDGTVVPHHEGKSGMGQKVSDYQTIPLCFECHSTRHSSKLTSWEEWDVLNKARAISRTQASYLNAGGRLKKT